uniref:Uncharacterized protein n=1 Tax=Cynoglossus semilaevis TaxID=244447 RepID=A0A3P8VM51_CYNSE
MCQTEEGKHDQIVALKEAGLTTKQIMKKVNICHKTVYNVMERYKETGKTTSKPIPGRKRSVRTKRVVEMVRNRVQRNLCRSVRTTAKEVNISKPSLRRIVKQDLRLKALKMQHRQLISATSKKKQLDRGQMMLQEIQSAANKVLVWSDEKIFTVQAVVNSQNDRVYAHSKPAGVMLWTAVASYGSKSPLVFIQEEKVLPWCTNVFGKQYIFTQDGAPTHTSNVTQTWCKQHFAGFWDKTMWPPSRPDINPMDFAIWSVMEREVSRVSHNSVTTLKKALMKLWSKLGATLMPGSARSSPGYDKGKGWPN